MSGRYRFMLPLFGRALVIKWGWGRKPFIYFWNKDKKVSCLYPRYKRALYIKRSLYIRGASQGQ